MGEPSDASQAGFESAHEGTAERRRLPLSRTQPEVKELHHELKELQMELKSMKFMLKNIFKDRDTLKTLQHYVRSIKSNVYV